MDCVDFGRGPERRKVSAAQGGGGFTLCIFVACDVY